MKHLLSILLLFCFGLTAHAGNDARVSSLFDENTRYYFRCVSTSSSTTYDNGYFCLGSEHGFAYPIYLLTGASTISDDGYWFVVGNDNDGYTFCNAATGQYLTWSSDYNTDRYLTLTDEPQDPESYWFVEKQSAYPDGYGVRTKAEQKGERDSAPAYYYFNLRTSGAHQFHLGTYQTTAFNGYNSRMRFFDADGHEVGAESQKTLTVYCVDASTDNILETLTYDFTDSYTLWEAPARDGYTFAKASESLPYTATGNSTIYLYYEPVHTSSDYYTSEEWTEASDYHEFGKWESLNHADNSTSQHTITFTCPQNAVLCFNCGVSSEGYCDWLRCTLDGVNLCEISGEETRTITRGPLDEGQHTLIFTYSKDGSVSNGSDAAWATDILYTVSKPSVATFHSIDIESGEEFDTYSYTFYGTYTISSPKTYAGYDYVRGDLSFPYVITESGDYWFYYCVKQSGLKTTQIVDGRFADGTIWYRMSIRGSKQIYAQPSGAVVCNTTSKPYDAAYFWCFVNAGNGLYQVYNYLTGPTLPMSAARSADATALQMNADGAYSYFNITENGSGFNLQLPGVTPSSCCNDHGSNGVLKLWTSNSSTADAGSRIVFESVGEVNFVEMENLYFTNAGTDNCIEMTEHGTYWLSYGYTPEDATLTSVVWSTDNKKVAEVDANGMVTATGEGTATITVTSTSNPSVSASCQVKVIGLIRVAEITADDLSLSVGQSATIHYTVSPDNAYDTTVKFSSSDPDIAFVDNAGRVTALAEGTAYIVVSANDDSGVAKSIVVTVVDPEKGIVVEHGDSYLYLTSAGDALLALPKDYLDGDYTLDETGHFSAQLVGGESFERSGIFSVSEELPVELPTFTSYKFNNKYNYQVFADIAAADPAAGEINLQVGAIGKRLTASFQVPDKQVVVWADGKRQVSKETRLRFDRPITYTIGRDAWVELQLKQLANGDTKSSLIPFGHHTTVNIDWLTDHPNNTYGVPEIYIVTEDGNPVTSKTEYKNATIEILGGGVFPDLPIQDVLIRGRGNTSWSRSKRPYRLKFEKKKDPFGLPKSKSWVLLANDQRGSMTTNAIGHKVASLMECAGACHIIPIELYLNNSYLGSYNFCEKVGFSNSSVEIDDETFAAMLELDTQPEATPTTVYTSNAYRLNTKIHDPDVGEADYEGQLTAEQIIADFDRMTQMVRAHDGSYVNAVDVPRLASYLSANEIICNCELHHPKSVFCYSEDVTDGFNLETGRDDTPWVFGPVWDCDWGFGYEQNNTYFVINQERDFFSELLGSGDSQGRGKQFWNDLRYGSEEMERAYYYRWHKFMNEGGLDELIEFCDDYFDYAALSLSHNREGAQVGDRSSDYSSITSNSKKWLKDRCNHIYSSIKAYDIPEEFTLGDLNADGEVTLVDLNRLMRVALGMALDTYGTADVNADGRIDRDDVEALAHKLLDK